MKPEKIPQLSKNEYDKLIDNQVMSRISFMGEDYPKVKPFIYHFNGRYIYFLATKYGEKMRYFPKSPKVTVEIENYEPDLSKYEFVTLSGELEVVTDEKEEEKIRKEFVEMINKKNLSKNIMKALGYSSKDPLEKIIEEKRNIVIKLVKVKDITGFKSGH